MKRFLAALLGLFAPFILIAGGAGLTALGAQWEMNVLVGTGLVIVAAGIFWGFILWYADSGGGSWFD